MPPSDTLIKSIVDEVISSIEHAHLLCSQSMIVCTQIVVELVDEVVKALSDRSDDIPLSSPPEETDKFKDTEEVHIIQFTPNPKEDFNSMQDLKLSQELPVRNLHDELTDVCGGATVAVQNLNPEEEQGDESSREFEALWQKRKLDVEKSAEGRARVVFRQWQRDRVTLEQAIDSSLKEYGEMYEKAHALRLMFEEEKSQWSRKVMSVHEDDTPYNDYKRRCTESNWSPPQAAWPYPQRQTVENEFQYAIEEEGDDSVVARYDISARTGGALGSTSACSENVPTPYKKQQKKFTVPIKLMHNE